MVITGTWGRQLPVCSRQNVVYYFIERKAQDGETNEDYKNVDNKAFLLFRHGHVQKVELASDNDRTRFRFECLSNSFRF